MRALIALYAVAQVLLLVVLAANHLWFPLNLTPLELTTLQHVKRLASGLALYPEPSADFVALAYNPLYYLWSIPFARVLGFDLTTLRLVAILGTAGAGALIFLALRRATGSAWWGVVALGLFAAAYRTMDCQLDNANYDSWLLCAVLLGCFLLDGSRSEARDALAVLATVLAFWFKQPGAFYAAGALPYLVWQRGPRRAWRCCALALLLGPVLYLAAGSSVFGPRFYYFTWHVPRQWMELDSVTLRRLATLVGRYYLVLAAFAALGWVRALRRGTRFGIWYFMLPIAALNGLGGAMDAGSSDNVFIPMGTWLIITGVLGLAELAADHPRGERRGLAFAALAVSFGLLFYDPRTVTVESRRAAVSYRDMVTYLSSLDGPVYAPWIGQLQDGYAFEPTAHWVPLEDMVRGPNIDVRDQPAIRTLLAPVVRPERPAYVLMNYPLEEDSLLVFLTRSYVLDRDLGDRFAALNTLPKKYWFGWPRYLYRLRPADERTAAVVGR